MLMLVRSFSYTPDARINEFVITVIMPVLLSFSYIPHTDHSGDVLKHFACWFGENLIVH